MGEGWREWGDIRGTWKWNEDKMRGCGGENNMTKMVRKKDEITKGEGSERRTN